MGNQSAVAFDEDDYFAEPDYDNFTDDELDELYNFGQIKGVVPDIRLRQKANLKSVSEDDDQFDEIELDFELDVHPVLDLDLYDEI